MYIAYHPLYNHPVPENHRFPMGKYALLPQQLLYEGIASASNFHTPEKATQATAALVHTQPYLHNFLHLTLSHKEALPIGFVQFFIKINIWLLSFIKAKPSFFYT